MILDYQNLFDNDLLITDTANSTNIIDLGNDSARVQVLNEKNATLFIQMTVACATLTTLQVGLHGDNSSGFGTNTQIAVTAAIAKATLVAGYRFTLALPIGAMQYQYLRLTYTVAGSTEDEGYLTAGLILDDQTST